VWCCVERVCGVVIRLFSEGKGGLVFGELEDWAHFGLITQLLGGGKTGFIVGSMVQVVVVGFIFISIFTILRVFFRLLTLLFCPSFFGITL